MKVNCLITLIISKLNLRLFIIINISLLLISCNKYITLIPTPIAYQSGVINPFANIKESDKSTQLDIYYATNRPAIGSENERSYANGFTTILRMGLSRMRIGEESLDWQTLKKISTSSDRAQNPNIYLKQSYELSQLKTSQTSEGDSDINSEFAQSVNKALKRKASKDIFIYLNGANSEFYNSVALASQFAHFNGHEAVTIAFAWPSEGSLLAYGQDVTNAGKTAPIFARFLAYLANNTRAENFYILAYSAGAQVASQGLYALRKTHATENIELLKQKFRISNVYFAAPDEDTHTFVTEHLPSYLDMVNNVTVSLMFNDSVLKIARWYHDSSRLGLPEPGVESVTGDQRAWLVDAIVSGKLDIIDMEFDAARPDNELDFSQHGNWYKNTWVMSDILLQFYFDAKPGQRGLSMDNMRYEFPTWFFSNHYPENINEAVKQLDKQHRLPENVFTE